MSLDINQPTIRSVDPEIFRVTFAADCMQHECRCRAENDRRRNDACCQYGADVLVPEKLAILRRASEIASVLKPERQDPGGWFDERDPELDRRGIRPAATGGRGTSCASRGRRPRGDLRTSTPLEGSRQYRCLEHDR